MRTIRRAGVLGAGTMGSRIAAHFANIGIPSVLLDLNAGLAAKGIETAAKQKPGAFYLDSAAALISPGSFDADLEKLRSCDWVIEAVSEKLDVKRDLWKRVEAAANADAVLSTNTSGIPLVKIAEGFSSPFRKRFLGTHFFNPPRYLHLMELIPGPETDPKVLSFVARFAEERLGKGIVPCKDTPNFIANRIGCFFGATVLKIALEDEYTVEEADALTGPLIGLPNSASFRLLDIVGIDVMAAVSENLYNGAANDPWRERFRVPEVMRELIQRGWLGEKSGQGFYKRVGPQREIHALNLKTLEYAPAGKVRLPEADAARNIEDLGDRLRVLLRGPDRAGTFLWKLYRDYFLYSAERQPEISDRIVEIDRALRWGFAHKLGPFELWEAIGFEGVCDRLVKDGCALPPNIEAMRRTGAAFFYRDLRRSFFDFASASYQQLAPPGLLLQHCAAIRKNAGASLKDLGEGVLCVEFHSKMNTLGFDQIEMIEAGLEETQRNFEAMVIGNQGETFSAGANLMLVLLAAEEGDWSQLGAMIHRFQQVNQAIKYSPKPVVAAPFGRALGGGAEVAMHGARRQASAETYIGLVEVGVGLLPAGGGCKELVARGGDIKKALYLAGQAQVSSSAAHAREMGFLTAGDRISINPDRLIEDAKSLALFVAQDYAPPAPAPVQVGGDPVYAELKLGIWTYHQGGYISDHDKEIGEKLALVLSGGRSPGPRAVSEQQLLDLEREAFLSLCGNPKTQERIRHTLKTGKPLRN